MTDTKKWEGVSEIYSNLEWKKKKEKEIYRSFQEMTETMYKCLDTKLNTKVTNLKYFVKYMAHNKHFKKTFKMLVSKFVGILFLLEEILTR